MHAGRPSATSRLIARATVLASRDAEQCKLVPTGAVVGLRRILAEDGNAHWFRFAERHSWCRAVLRRLESAVLPGITTHYLVRKHWIEAAVRESLNRGIRQVVVLGAGFDTLAWRLHSAFPAVTFIEVDHPATQAPKRRALSASRNFSYVSGDLSRDSIAGLLESCPAHSPAVPTLFVAEGLLMYLQPPRVAALLDELALVRPSRTELVFSYMAQARDGSIDFRGGSRLIGWWLRRCREPFHWGIRSTALQDSLRSRRLHVIAAANHDSLKNGVLAPQGLAHLPLARGERLCHCSTADRFPRDAAAGITATDEESTRRSRHVAPPLPGAVAPMLAAILLLTLSGCTSVNRLAMNRVSDALAGGGTTFASDDDPALIRDAAPFSLKLMESLLEQNPAHTGLRLAAASGFTQYAYAFVQQDAEAIEESDTAAAAVLRTRARRLFLRGREHGLIGLNTLHPGMRSQLATAPRAALQACTRADVPLLYWTAAAWASAITNGKDQPGLIADLPAVEALIDRAHELDEAYDHGAIHSFLIAYEMNRPGGTGDPVARARTHFDRAQALTGGGHAGPLLAFAENICVQQQDRITFQSLLHQALAIDPDVRPEWRLVNLVLQARARRLLARIDELFLPPENAG